MSGEVITNSMRIDKLRSNLLDGNIKVPPFQREFVWKKDQIIELLDSIKNDYPIGSILFWESKYFLPSQRNIGGYLLPEVQEEYPLNYVLDGQQRITSIFGVFAKEDLAKEADIDYSLFDIYYDLKTKTFLAEKPEKDSTPHIPLNIIYDNFEFNRYIREFDRDLFTNAVEIQSIFQNYEIPTVTIKKREKTEVGLIFERINNTGTKLSSLDLMIAWTWVDEFHLKDKFDNIFEALQEKNFGDISEKVVLQALGAIIKETTKSKEILELDPSTVRDNIDNLTKAFEKTIDFISTQFKCDSLDFLPRIQTIVPLVYFFNNVNSIDTDQNTCLKKWFWRVSFSDRYAASTDQKMDDDIKFMKDILDKKYIGIEKYKTTVTEEKISNIVFSKSNSYAKAFILLMAQHTPKDLTNNQIIDCGKALSVYNRKEFHHIFPNAFLKDIKLQTKEINKLVNFCFLPASSNKLISDKKPSFYFHQIIPAEHRDSILESNLIPIDADIYSKDNYQLFISERSKIILQAIQKYAA